MNESYRMGEQSIIAHLQRLANGASTAELDVDALPTELRAVGEQLQKTLAVLQQERQLLERSAYIDSLTNLGNRGGLDRMSISSGAKALPLPVPILTSITLSTATISLATPRATAIFWASVVRSPRPWSTMKYCSVSVEMNLYSCPPR